MIIKIEKMIIKYWFLTLICVFICSLICVFICFSIVSVITPTPITLKHIEPICRSMLFTLLYWHLIIWGFLGMNYFFKNKL